MLLAVTTERAEPTQGFWDEFDLQLFFFSSRRPHTSWTGDWSSDVCSSDLKIPAGHVVTQNIFAIFLQTRFLRLFMHAINRRTPQTHQSRGDGFVRQQHIFLDQLVRYVRSEERRVGKECWSVSTPFHYITMI